MSHNPNYHLLRWQRLEPCSSIQTLTSLVGGAMHHVANSHILPPTLSVPCVMWQKHKYHVLFSGWGVAQCDNIIILISYAGGVLNVVSQSHMLLPTLGEFSQNSVVQQRCVPTRSFAANCALNFTCGGTYVTTYRCATNCVPTRNCAPFCGLTFTFPTTFVPLFIWCL